MLPVLASQHSTFIQKKARARNYTIRAYAHPVPGETDTADNTVTYGCVIVALVGDVTGRDGWPDREVDMRDVGAIARLYSTSYRHPLYDADCDVIYDLKIDMQDIGLVAKEFGKTM